MVKTREAKASTISHRSVDNIGPRQIITWSDGWPQSLGRSGLVVKDYGNKSKEPRYWHRMLQLFCSLAFQWLILRDLPRHVVALHQSRCQFLSLFSRCFQGHWRTGSLQPTPLKDKSLRMVDGRYLEQRTEIWDHRHCPSGLVTSHVAKFR